MGSAFLGADIVGKRIQVLIIAVIILNSYLDNYIVFLFFKINRITIYYFIFFCLHKLQSPAVPRSNVTPF